MSLFALSNHVTKGGQTHGKYSTKHQYCEGSNCTGCFQGAQPPKFEPAGTCRASGDFRKNNQQSGKQANHTEAGRLGPAR